MTYESRIFCPKNCDIFELITYLNVTEAKQTTSLLLLDNFCPVMSFTDEFRRKRKRRIIVYRVRSLVIVREPVASAMRNFVNSASEEGWIEEKKKTVCDRGREIGGRRKIGFISWMIVETRGRGRESMIHQIGSSSGRNYQRSLCSLNWSPVSRLI